MIYKIVKKLWLICLWIASLCLVGCFHIPDKDWLPSKNKINTWNVENNDEIEEVIDSFLMWVDMVSTQRNGTIDDENSKTEIENESVIWTWGIYTGDDNSTGSVTVNETGILDDSI